MKYLDDAGLSYFWGKAKAAFAGRDVATSSSDGLMSASDKRKINALSTQQDTITAQGVSGYWRYRHWESGLYECWLMHTYGTVSLSGGSSPVGYSYESGLQAMVAYPVTFSELPNIQMRLTYVSGVNGFVPFFASAGTTARTGYWRAVNPRPSLTGGYYLELYVCGLLGG